MVNFVGICAMIIFVVSIYRKDLGMNNVRKIIGLLIIPIALTLITLILFLNGAKLPKPMTLPYISYAFFSIGMMLGIRFNKSKVFFLSLMLAVSQFLLANGPKLFHDIAIQPDISDILSFLIPINILLFSLSKERGIFSLWGKIKFGILIVQALLVRLLLDPPNHDLRNLISFKLTSASFISNIPVPQSSLLLFIILLAFLCVRLYLNPTLMESTLVGVTVMVFAGVLTRAHAAGPNLFFAAAGLLLVISLLETSHSMAYRDELTGLPSRRSLEEAMMKLGNKYSIAMLDIDFFKKFNDSYGHDIGDKVLKNVAASLMEADIGGRAFRYGGEEFTILFPNKSQAEVIPMLEELRKGIAKEKHSYKKKNKDKSATKKLGVTVSIGIAEKNERYRTPEEVIQAADKALYRAKKNGRNCVSK